MCCYGEVITADCCSGRFLRKGCEGKVLETFEIVKKSPKRIAHVSCNPVTLAKNLVYLSERKYKTMEVKPVDVFSYTAHPEYVALIERG